MANRPGGWTRGQGYSQSVDLIKNSRDQWNREGEQQVTLDPHEQLQEKSDDESGGSS